MLHKIIKGIAPVAAVALAAGLAGCDNVDVTINGNEGVPLSELDMSGDPPEAVAMMGPDTVIISEGDTLEIDVEGDSEAVDAVRFVLDDGTLGVLRENDGWKGKGQATIRVTMPAPRELDMAGSGRIESFGMADTAEINMAGSGTIAVAELAASSLEVNMAGSGSVSGAGSADQLEVSMLGSGGVKLDELKADRAEVSIAGSGDVAFASDGEVEANIAGSGNVRVIGRATCEVNAFGSGKVSCEPAAEDEREDA